MERLLQSCACEHASDATHLSLIGGKFKMTNVDLFFRMYLKSYTLGAHLVEKVSYPSKWYVDLDHISPDYVHRGLKDLLVRHGEDCIVCAPSEGDAAHIIFHKVIVDSPDQAIQRTSTLFTDFDRSVYRSGLRMLGSKKKASVDRAYYPCYSIRDGTVCERQERTLTYEDLVHASIHTGLPAQKTARGPWISQSPPVTGDLDFSFVHPAYKRVGVSQIKAVGGQWIQVMVKSRFCMNVDREHTSNHVYFVIRDANPMELHAKCFNNCECKGYKSKKYRVPVVLFYTIKNKIGT